MNKTNDNVIILIPPSEGKTEGGEHQKLDASKLNSITKELIKQLNNYDGDLEKLYGVKGKKLEETITTNKNILNSKTLQAISRYSGVVYQGIDYESLSKEQQNIFNDRVYMISGLFGLVKSDQFIPDYKLKIDKLKSDKLWKKEFESNNEFNDTLNNNFIIDLLPKAHRKAVSYNNGIEVEFVIIKNGKKIPAGHNGKLIKGRFVRWLIKNNITNEKEFSKFNEDGFVWKNNEFIKEI